MAPRYPSLFEMNTRVWLTQLARTIGRPATLDDIPDVQLDRLADLGFDWIWLLSVWQTSPASRRVSLKNPVWQKEFQETLPDLSEEDIGGSGFAIHDYSVSTSMGGNEALRRLRHRLRERGMRLMLDFVPNHTGLDHVFLESHPDFYLEGTEADLQRQPQNYCRIKNWNADRILAHGRDPYFPGWPDTLQLDYSNPATQEAMIGELLRISDECDGVRCDMAMLLLPNVFERTWHRRSGPFWSCATKRVRERVPDFHFMAEVYWDLEWTMQQQGFDYAYDKRLYDRLREGHAHPVREHLRAGLDFQDKLSRFIENHDEPRAADTFTLKMHEAAAIVTFLSPGLRFFHQGQFEGRKKRLSPHLVRAPLEAVNNGLMQFYQRVLAVLRLPIVREGEWHLLECASAWGGNSSCDNFVAFSWEAVTGERLLVTVNYADAESQCYVRFPFVREIAARTVCLQDLMSTARYERGADELASRGLYLDLPPWGYHVFEVRTC
jgi:hypothetical protein